MEKKHDLPWYPWHVDKWRASRKVAKMNATERGIYRELLDECWVEGSIPEDAEGLCEVANCTRAELDAAWPVVGKCFTLRADGRYVNAKIAAVLLAQLEAIERKRVGGKKGGKQTQAKLKDSLSHAKARERGDLTTLSPDRAGVGGRLDAPPPLHATPPSANGKGLRDLQGTPIPDVNAIEVKPMDDKEKRNWRAMLESAGVPERHQNAEGKFT